MTPNFSKPSKKSLGSRVFRLEAIAGKCLRSFPRKTKERQKAGEQGCPQAGGLFDYCYMD